MFLTKTYLDKQALMDLYYHTYESHQKQIVLDDHGYFS